MISVNLHSTHYGRQAIFPHVMERDAGHLVNVSSYLGRVPIAPVRSVYSASKAALNSLTANLRMDLKREYPNIHVSLVMPGIVATDFASNALGGTPSAPPPPGALTPHTAEEVAATIASLIATPD